MLVTRLYDWFFGPAGSSGQGRALSWSVDQPWPVWITLVLLLLFTIWVFSSYLRERKDVARWKKISLAWVRLVLLLLSLVMLYRFQLLEYKTDLPDLLVLLDVSRSMGIDDAAPADGDGNKWKTRIEKAGFSKPTRLDTARTFLLEKDARHLKWLSRHYRLKIFTIGQNLQPLPADGINKLPDDPAGVIRDIRQLAAGEDASRLGDTARTALEQSRGRPVAGLIVFTDGMTTDGITLSEAAKTARRRGVPILTIGLGDQRPPRDAMLSDLSMDSVTFVGDILPVEVQLTSTGFESDEKIKIVIRRADSPDILASKEVPAPGPGTSDQVFLAIQPAEKGRFEYVIEALPAEGESKVENNRLSRIVQVRDDSVRVLLIDSQPSFEFRYLKELLSRRMRESDAPDKKKNKEFELAAALLEGDPEVIKYDPTTLAGLPVTREDLFKYDVVILADANPQRIENSFLENLFAFVDEKGGGVIFIAGERFMPRGYASTPISPLFPVDPATATLPPVNIVAGTPWPVRRWQLGGNDPLVRLGDSPAQTQKLWAETPDLYWIATSLSVRPGARVLAEAYTRIPAATRTEGIAPEDAGTPTRPELPGLSAETTIATKPVIISRYVGAGRVIFHATDETWRWSLPRENRFFERYWVRLIRSLSRVGTGTEEDDIELSSDRDHYTGGEKVHLRVRFFDPTRAPASDDGVAVSLESDRGERRRVLLHRGTTRGVFQATISELPTGAYRAVLAEPALDNSPPSWDFLVSDAHGEMAVTQMNASDLKNASEMSGGKFYTIENLDTLMRGIPAAPPVPIEQLDPIPVWNSHLLIILFMSLLVLEWILRRRMGMM